MSAKKFRTREIWAPAPTSQRLIRRIRPLSESMSGVREATVTSGLVGRTYEVHWSRPGQRQVFVTRETDWATFTATSTAAANPSEPA